MSVIDAASTLALAVGTLSGALVTAYLVVLTVAALVGARYRRHPAVSSNYARQHRFAILIPAHNEELLIGRLLDSLDSLDYARHQFDVHVVADNCTDTTAQLARAGGAIVHERFDDELKAKGFALRWLIERLSASSPGYDAYVVLDADSIVAPNLLSAFDVRLRSGSAVIQAYYSVLNAGESSLASLRYAALAALHYARPLGRTVLGLSCGLKGNGMCFASSIVDSFGWNWFTLTEDVEFHLALVSRGVRVDFAPETWVLADMPVTFAQAASQNERWERGRLQFLRGRIPRLLASGVRERSALKLDAAIEQLIPPLSVPFALGSVCLVLAAARGDFWTAGLALVTLVGQMAHLVVALLLVRAPRPVWVALAYSPVYVCWKLALYVRALCGTRSQRWIRTGRAA